MKRLRVQVLVILALANCCFAQSQNYCGLFDSMKYDQKTVKTTAILYSSAKGETRVDGGSDEFFYLKNCNNRDYFAEADFSQTKNLKAITNQSKHSSDKNSPKLYLVTFTGKFSLSFLPTFGHLGWLRAGFLVDEINSVKPLKYDYILPDSKNDAPILETGNSLQSINSEFMSSLFAIGLYKQDIDYPLASNSEISVNGKSVDNKLIPQLFNTEKQGSVATRVKNVTANKNEWNIQGTVTITTGEKILHQLNYDNKFLLQKDKSWKLLYSNIKEIQPLKNYKEYLKR